MKIDIFGKATEIKEQDLSEMGLAGYYDMEKSLIVIDKNSDHKFQTCCHELFHNALHRVGINQTSLPRDVQEIIVESLATLIDEKWSDIVKLRRKYK